MCTVADPACWHIYYIQLCTQSMLCCALLWLYYIDGLMQERLYFGALAMELCLYCTNPSICWLIYPYPSGTSPALWQYDDSPSATEVTIINMDKYIMLIQNERLCNHNKARQAQQSHVHMNRIYCKKRIEPQQVNKSLWNTENTPASNFGILQKVKYATHLLSCLIRCVNMKWIWLVLWEIQSEQDLFYRRTDGQTDKVKPVYPHQLRWRGGITNMY